MTSLYKKQGITIAITGNAIIQNLYIKVSQGREEHSKVDPYITSEWFSIDHINAKFIPWRFIVSIKYLIAFITYEVASQKGQW